MNNDSVTQAVVDANARYASCAWPPYALGIDHLLSRRQYLAAERLLDDALDGCAPELNSNPFAHLTARPIRGDFNMNRLKILAIGARCVTDALAVLDRDMRTAVVSAVVMAEPVQTVASVILLRAALYRLAEHYDAHPFDDEVATWLDLMRAARQPLRYLLASTPYKLGESSEEWMARLAANPAGLSALHQLYEERLRLGAHHVARGSAVVIEDFPIFVQRVGLESILMPPTPPLPAPLATPS